MERTRCWRRIGEEAGETQGDIDEAAEANNRRREEECEARSESVVGIRNFDERRAREGAREKSNQFSLRPCGGGDATHA